MQDSKEINVTQEYKLGKFKFTFPTYLKFIISEDDSYITITFLIENDNLIGNKFDKYEIINNYYLGYRLFISNKTGWQDVPFKKETFWLLPPEVKVSEE